GPPPPVPGARARLPAPRPRPVRALRRRRRWPPPPHRPRHHPHTPSRHAQGADLTLTATPPALRPPAHQAYAEAPAALAKADDRPRPPGWKLSPWAVTQYVLGATLDDGTEITPKYVGARRIVEVAVATLATDRALLLLGVPGTAKT